MTTWYCHLFDATGMYVAAVHVPAAEPPRVVELPMGTYRYRANSRTGVDLWFDEEPVTYIGKRPS